ATLGWNKRRCRPCRRRSRRPHGRARPSTPGRDPGISFSAQVRSPRALRSQPNNSSARRGCIGAESWHSHDPSRRSSIREECHNEKRFLMLSPFRFAGIITVIFAVCGPARGQAIAPAGSGVTIDKVDVYNGLAHTVKYYVKGGSPRLQALVRRVEWAENELSV